jgi:hypothetical protein
MLKIHRAILHNVRLIACSIYNKVYPLQSLPNHVISTKKYEKAIEYLSKHSWLLFNVYESSKITNLLFYFIAATLLVIKNSTSSLSIYSI